MEKTTYILSIIVPTYNEEATLKTCLQRILEIENDDIKLQIIIVDDGSTDNSFSIAESMKNKYSQIDIVKHKINQGKGAAIQSGLTIANGDYVAIQDADLEYNPQDLLRLLKPLQEDKADVVLGSRFISEQERRVLYFWHAIANKILTLFSNIVTNLNLTDMETCYKVFRRDKIMDLRLKEKRFGFEPEIIAKIAKKKLRIYEVGISYSGRTYVEGKKITLKDGIRAMYCILYYNIWQ